MTRKPILTVLLLAALTALPGCTSDAESAPKPGPSVFASPPPWTEPAAYEFVLERRCDTGPDLGRYRVTVTEGAVSQTDRIDGRTATGEEEVEVPALGELLELAQTAIEDGADATTVHDPVDGHPREVTIDRGDGPSCFRVSEYKPAG